MIARTLTAVALVAGAALFCLPAQATTGSQDGSQGAMQGASSTMNKGAPAQQAQAPASNGPRSEATEREMTKCLNNAVLQHKSFDLCKP